RHNYSGSRISPLMQGADCNPPIVNEQATRRGASVEMGRQPGSAFSKHIGIVLCRFCRRSNHERLLRGLLYTAARAASLSGLPTRGIRVCVSSGFKADEKHMKSSTTSIFRPQAVRRYAERAAEPVFPKFAMPRAFLPLWVLLVVLAALASLALCSPVPIYVRGV